MISRILGLSQSILDLPKDKTKSCEKRRALAIEAVSELINYCNIANAKELFLTSIKSDKNNEQYSALQGFENYYDITDEEIDVDTLNVLNKIVKETDDRTIASTCLQIQINAGVIDEFNAIIEMDDWKDEH